MNGVLAKHTRAWLVWVGSVGGFLAPSSLASAQEPGPSQQAVTSDGITREQALQRLSELEQSAGEDNKAIASLTKSYRQIVAALEAIRSHQEKAAEFQDDLDQAPGETDTLREQLSLPPTPPRELPPGSTVTSVQQALSQAQANLTNSESELTRLEQRIVEQRERPNQAQTLLAEARAARQEIEQELAEPAPAADAPEGERVQRTLREVEFAARTAEIHRLEQELLSNGVRVDLLVAQRDTIAARMSEQQARVSDLEARLSELRQQEAERARVEAERLHREAMGKHPVIRELAAEVAELARELEPLGPAIDQTRQQRAEVEKQLTKVKDSREEAARFLEIGITEALGAVLLEMRRSLPSTEQIEDSIANRASQLADLRLRQFHLERALKAKVNRHAEVASLVDQVTLDTPLSQPERSELTAELQRLVDTKFDNLERLSKANGEHILEYWSLESDQRELLLSSQALAAVLDERLLWIRNAPAFSFSTLQGIPRDLGWFLSPFAWQAVGSRVWQDARAAMPLYGLVGLVLLGLTGFRRRLRQNLKSLGSKVGRHRQDDIRLTVQALLIQVIRALPLAGLLAFLGWRLWTGTKGDFPSAVGAGLLVVALVLFFAELLRTMHHADGVAATHFRWAESVCRLVRHQTLWFVVFALATGFVIAVAQTQSELPIRHGIGRLAFVTLMVALLVLASCLLHPRGGLLSESVATGHWAWMHRSRGLWIVLAMAVPITLAILAMSGYYYGALELLIRVIWALLWILGTLLLRSFLLRWLVISQRRLAVKVAQEKREALAKSREQGESDAVTEGLVEAYEAVNVSDIKQQTHDLVNISVGMLFLVGMWLSWSGVLPALQVLDGVHLWNHKVVTEGREVLQPITLSDLGLGLILLLVTLAATRKIPSFLEIAILQRLPLDAGSRYAARTLTLYLIVALGVVSAFNAIGVGWGSVQWLVAALTVGLGFGLQEIFANFVSGLIILLERPIRVGDTVTVGNVSGVVTRIRMRATTITDWNRKELIVPNKNFITGELINWSLSDPILRLDFLVGLAYGSDTPLAHQVLTQACKDHPLVLDQPEPTVFFSEFGDNSLNFEVRVFVAEASNTARSRILHDLHMTIDNACRKHDIEIAFPQRDLHLKSAPAVIRIARAHRTSNPESPEESPGGSRPRPPERDESLS